MLSAQHLVKAFAGRRVIEEVTLQLERGEVVGLLGPNGAGKTTTFNLLTKFLPATRGSILYNGQDITRERPADVARRGIIRSFQISAVFPNLTVLENVRVALQRGLGTSFYFWKREKSLAVLNERAMALLERVDLARFSRIHAGELAYGRKRTLEIATTLAMDPELMLLDEPTAGMGHEDVARVKALIQQVAVGRTVLMVEHNMSVVSGICDTITVLQRGAVLAEGPYAQVAADPRVIEAYMGSIEGDPQALHG
jgi:branched-chain amino acid transport system ATP-binding protein